VPVKIQDAPIVTHRKAGAECEGVILPEPDDEQVVLKCNVCGAVVGSIQATVLCALEEAIADRLFSDKFTGLDAPQSLASVSEQCQRGQCEQCPGQFRGEEGQDQTIFCLHSCHTISDQGERDIN
jgi:hypothetical protein